MKRIIVPIANIDDLIPKGKLFKTAQVHNETITWIEYPKRKPTKAMKKKMFMLTILNEKAGEHYIFYDALFDFEKKEFYYAIDGHKVVSWAIEPQGFVPEDMKK